MTLHPELLVPESEVSSILTKLVSREHLSRTKAYRKLHSFVHRIGSEQKCLIRDTLVSALYDEESCWESRCGSLMGLKVLVEYENSRKCGEGALEGDVEWVDKVVEKCLKALIECGEVRERRVAAEVMGVIVARDNGGVEVWERCTKELLEKVQVWMTMGREERLKDKKEGVRKEIGFVGKGVIMGNGKSGLMHETEGWRGLETGLVALGKMVDGCGEVVVKRDGVDALSEIVESCMKAGEHENRFVREASLTVLTNVVMAVKRAGFVDGGGLPKKIVQAVKRGLDDNWSQVRYAASVAVRTMLESCVSTTKRDLYPILLPRMCLNRHYVAEGVRIYSQTTWRKVIGDDGRVYLVKLLPQVVAYYQSQCGANNHAVREAACQSLAEVATRLDPNAVRPLVALICSALIDCFKDESWPVRDHACLALSKIANSFPKEVEATGMLVELYNLFEAHLADNIPSVRDNTAMALVDASRGFDRAHPIMGSDRLILTAEKLLKRISDQKEHEGLKKIYSKDTHFGAAHKIARDNDEELHTDLMRFSCGSLAPKLRRGGGCMDHGFTRPKAPWEEADGGMKLMTCLAQGADTTIRDAALKLLPLSFDSAHIARGKQFAHITNCLLSFWNELEKCARVAPKDVWTEELLTKAIPIMDDASKCGFERVENAARRVVRHVRFAAGSEKFDRIEKATAEGASDN